METHIISKESHNTIVSSSELLKGSFTWMAYGLLVSGIIAMIVVSTPAIYSVVLGSAYGLIAFIIAELALVWYISARIHTLSPDSAKALFLIYATLSGATLSFIFVMYQITSIISIFLSTAVLFAMLAYYGATTKTDLTAYGKIAFIGLITIIISSVINMFIGSTLADMIIAWIGVAVFTVLTAYDTQKIARMKADVVSVDDIKRVHVIGALTLYLDFINLFLSLLRIFGRRR